LVAVEKKSLVTFEVKARPNHDFNWGVEFRNYLSFFRCNGFLLIICYCLLGNGLIRKNFLFHQGICYHNRELHCEMCPWVMGSSLSATQKLFGWVLWHCTNRENVTFVKALYCNNTRHCMKLNVCFNIWSFPTLHVRWQSLWFDMESSLTKHAYNTKNCIFSCWSKVYFVFKFNFQRKHHCVPIFYPTVLVLRTTDFAFLSVQDIH